MQDRGLKVFAGGCFCLCLAAAATLFSADETAPAGAGPAPAAITKEHKWLGKLVGDWTIEATCSLGPDGPSQTMSGTESARLIGERWLVVDGAFNQADFSMRSLLTIGFNAETGKFQGTWLDSMTDHLWKYEGTLDEAGRTLTLDTEGPNPLTPGKLAKFREVLELKSNDHKVFTSSILGEDGKWAKFTTIEGRRKK